MARWPNNLTKNIWGLVKTPSPFNCFFFHTLSFFFSLIVFPSAGFTPWPKDSHERGKGKGKGRVKEGKGKHRKGRGKGKGKEKERERKGKGKRKEKRRKRNRWKRKKERTRKGKEKEKEKEGKGKRRGKGEERQGKRKKRTVSHTDHFWCQKLSFSLSFCYRSWILCTFLFSGNGCNHQKRSVATTYQAPSLCRIWHALVGAPLRRQTMKWRNQNTK